MDRRQAASLLPNAKNPSGVALILLHTHGDGHGPGGRVWIFLMAMYVGERTRVIGCGLLVSGMA